MQFQIVILKNIIMNEIRRIMKRIWNKINLWWRIINNDVLYDQLTNHKQINIKESHFNNTIWTIIDQTNNISNELS